MMRSRVRTLPSPPSRAPLSKLALPEVFRLCEISRQHSLERRIGRAKATLALFEAILITAIAIAIVSVLLVAFVR